MYSKKPYVLLLTALLLIAFTPPGTRPGAGGWQVYVRAMVVNTGNAGGLKPGRGNPEAAALHFYASLVRRDQAFHQVLPPTKPARQQVLSALNRMPGRLVSATIDKRKALRANCVVLHTTVVFKQGNSVNQMVGQTEVRLVNRDWYLYKPPF